MVLGFRSSYPNVPRALTNFGIGPLDGSPQREPPPSGPGSGSRGNRETARQTRPAFERRNRHGSSHQVDTRHRHCRGRRDSASTGLRSRGRAAQSVSRGRGLGEASRRTEVGPTISVDVDRDGRSVWVFERCGGDRPAHGSSFAPILKFDSSGKLVKSFGAGMFVCPHGIHVDRDGNVWVTDGRGKGRQGPSGLQVQPGRQGADDARQGGRRRRRSGHVQSAVRRRWSRRTATSSSPTATAATPTRAS